MKAITYGGIITSWRVPDRTGQIADIVLGYDDAAAYIENNSPYFGAIVGRYGNRIAKAQFGLDGQTYALAANNGVNHLHGGNQGFDKVVWQGEAVRDAGAGVAFSRTQHGRRGRVSGKSESARDLHADRQERAASWPTRRRPTRPHRST